MKIILLLLGFAVIRQPQPPIPKAMPYFVAMQYKGIRNCIYKVYATDNLIFAAKVNGYITVEPSFGMGTTIPKSKMHDPEAYIDKKMDVYDGLLADHAAFLRADKENFIINKADIKRIYHDPKQKWGMGYYPHTGRIEVEANKTSGNRQGDREFILVGDQHPDAILQLLQAK